MSSCTRRKSRLKGAAVATAECKNGEKGAWDSAKERDCVGGNGSAAGGDGGIGTLYPDVSQLLY